MVLQSTINVALGGQKNVERNFVLIISSDSNVDALNYDDYDEKISNIFADKSTFLSAGALGNIKSMIKENSIFEVSKTN